MQARKPKSAVYELVTGSMLEKRGRVVSIVFSRGSVMPKLKFFASVSPTPALIEPYCFLSH